MIYQWNQNISNISKYHHNFSITLLCIFYYSYNYRVQGLDPCKELAMSVFLPSITIIIKHISHYYTYDRYHIVLHRYCMNYNKYNIYRICNHTCTYTDIYWYISAPELLTVIYWYLLIFKRYWYSLIYQWIPLIFPS